MNQLQTITARMLEIENTNMNYNRSTNFGRVPNGKEKKIELLLNEWDLLKAERTKIKNHN